MKRYNIVRLYFNGGRRRRIITRNVSLEAARKHCKNPETSSSTCTNSVGRARTKRMGPWFDAYTEA